MSDPATPISSTVSSAPPAAGASPVQVRAQAAIARASARTGVDFSYLLAQARIESGLDPQAEARTSSASGLFQFIDQTWLSTLDRHGAALGLGNLAEAIDVSGGRARVSDPATREAILDLRFDPDVASLMAGALAGDNAAALTPVLGRAPDAAELYLAHFLGAEGASQFLGALGQNPDGSAAAVLPRAARANQAIFYAANGAPRSLAEVMGVIRGRVDRAMSESGAPPANFAQPGWNPPSTRSDWASARQPSPLPARMGLPSMADTLRTSFGLSETGGEGTPGLSHIRNAYARLEAFGL